MGSQVKTPRQRRDARYRGSGSIRTSFSCSAYLLARLCWRRECPAPTTAPAAALPVAAPIAAPAAAPLAVLAVPWGLLLLLRLLLLLGPASVVGFASPPVASPGFAGCAWRFE